jgi:hypothetical protein
MAWAIAKEKANNFKPLEWNETREMLSNMLLGK